MSISGPWLPLEWLGSNHLHFRELLIIVPEGNILIRRAAVARPWISIFVVVQKFQRDRCPGANTFKGLQKSVFERCLHRR